MFLKKLKIKLTYDAAIRLLGIYPEKIKTLIRKDTCTSMFTATLFTRAETWKQPSAHQQMTGLRRCGICIQWNTTQP